MRLVAAVLTAASLAPLAAWAADARVEAAQLAILAERVCKLHAQVSHGVAAERARRAMAPAVREFERHLATASAESPAAMREHYALLALLWHEHRAWMARAPGRDAMRGEDDRAEELTWLALKGLQQAGVLPGAADDAARAARLSQRVARLAIVRRGRDTRALAESENAALADMREALARLDSAAAKSAATAEVEVAANQFLFLLRALGENGTARSAANLDVAARSADNILEALQRAMQRMVPALSLSPPA